MGKRRKQQRGGNLGSEPRKYSQEWFRWNAKRQKMADQETRTNHKGDPEHQLQCECIRWFDLSYPAHRFDLFAVPNGGHRHIRTASKMKAEGVRAGVADLILDYPGNLGDMVYIEMKTEKGRQSGNQKEFEKRCQEKGRSYRIVRNFDEFRELIQKHMVT